MTQLIHSHNNNNDLPPDIKEISTQFKELSILSKYLPFNESQIIDRLMKLVDDLNNPKILKYKMLKLKIANRYGYSLQYLLETSQK